MAVIMAVLAGALLLLVIYAIRTKNSDQNMPTPTSLPSQGEIKPINELKENTERLQLKRSNSPFAVDWLSDSEASQMPAKDLLSKAKLKSKESFIPRLINTRQEACNYLNVNFSFADFPSKAFESSGYFFFSAPLTQDFSKGFAINKETGEIATW